MQILLNWKDDQRKEILGMHIKGDESQRDVDLGDLVYANENVDLGSRIKGKGISSSSAVDESTGADPRADSLRLGG